MLIAAGMILFARMDLSTSRAEVLRAMIVAGFGMGLLMPVYTVAVQNVAPRKHMGAATASTTFFRQIGSTVGVAVFGSLMLRNYHQDFAKGVPAGCSAGSSRAIFEPSAVGANASSTGSYVRAV